VGIAAIIVLGDNPLTRRVGRRVLLWVIAGATALAFVFVLIRNPSLTGRTTYWSIALDAWQTSPMFGVGVSGFGGDSELSIAGTNAHNLIFDAIVKYGLVGAVFIVAVIVISTWITLKATGVKQVLPIGIFATYLTIGLAESDQGWLSVSLPWLWLVLAVLLAGRAIEASAESTHGRGEPLSGGSSAEGHETLARQE
jgi:O-antigen ligase